MPFSPVSGPPGRPPTRRPGDDPGRAAQHVRRRFLVVNAVPLAIGVVLSCSTALCGATVYGRLTLGVVWGVLQLGVLLGSVWWYEARSARLCDPVERPPAGTAGGPAAREPGW
ncbi:hypothetical protein GCM10010377_23710 [Streptomyces viridiviolaceus]|uniref:Integral membrane protein n=1 Tax=Streptomyces viridiviolaceus TaxID=68282 RepID=A0ABW2DRK7_9ACTN|nr:hypothetical protein [Streptomyces viridiviolaceus]GHB32562.1 hypothetical protein GCM10010377_23710 [Streptomyces viridiviolaceus]